MNQKVIEEIRKMNKERDWDQFHTGENLAKSIAIESGELLELFQWGHEAKSVDRLKEELADVLSYCYMLADRYGFDVDQIVLDKYKKTKRNTPLANPRDPAKSTTNSTIKSHKRPHIMSSTMNTVAKKAETKRAPKRK